jgi:hypothetical protein
MTQTETDPDPTGLTETESYYPRGADESGTLTAEIIEHDPDIMTGFREPAEVAMVRLAWESESGDESKEAYVRVYHVAPKLQKLRVGEPEQWVREAWAIECDETGDPVRNGHGRNELFNYSTPRPLNWSDLLEDVTECVEYVIH